MVAQHDTCAQQDWTADTAGPGPGSSQAGATSGFTPQELKLRQQQRERRKSGLARKEQVIVPSVLEPAVRDVSHPMDGLKITASSAPQSVDLRLLLSAMRHSLAQTRRC